MTSRHSLANFKNSCVIAPREPSTGLPTTSLDRESYDNFQIGKAKSASKKLNNSTRNLTHSQKETVIDQYQTLSSEFSQAGKQGSKFTSFKNQSEKKFSNNSLNELLPFDNVVLNDLINDDEKFFQHLQILKEENKKTLKKLQHLYRSKIGNFKELYASSDNISIYGNQDKVVVTKEYLNSLKDTTSFRDQSRNFAEGIRYFELCFFFSSYILWSLDNLLLRTKNGYFFSVFNGTSFLMGLFQIVSMERSESCNFHQKYEINY